MVKIIQRKSDNQYLVSAQNDIWTENVSEAFEMNIFESEEAKVALSNKYAEGDLKEILNFQKTKIASKEEKKLIRNLFKK